MATGLTTEQIAERQWKPTWWIEAVLHDEARRGHVELVGDRWQATPRLIRDFGGALAYVTGPPPKTTNRRSI